MQGGPALAARRPAQRPFRPNPLAVANRGKSVADRLPHLVLALVVLGGFGLRVAGLGDSPLRVDELNHYYVALALERGDNPVLPSGEWYLRGLDYTRAVRLALAHVEPVERAVRLPSALLGCLGLALFAAIAWSMIGPWPAVYATLLFALYPEAIHQSRSGRFYTMQMVFGLAALFAGWRALARPSRLRRQWAWVIVTSIALVMAARVQVVALSVAVAWGILVMGAAFLELRKAGRSAVRSSMPVQLCIVGAVVACGVLLARPELPAGIAARATQIPFWAAASGSQDVTYVQILAQYMPVLLIAGGASLYWAARRTPAGVYLAAWFGLPFLLHSAVPWHNGRFILLALPALFLAVGIGVHALMRVLHARVSSGLAARLPAPLPALVAGATVAALALVSVAPTPAFSRALRPLGQHDVSGWQESLDIANALPGGRSIPIGHTQPLTALHYWGRMDFTVSEGAREQWLTAERKREQLGVLEPGGYVLLPMGSADLYTGRPVLSTADAIRSRFAAEGEALIGIDTRTTSTDGLLLELYRVLETDAIELCQGRCGPQRLYHWRFERLETNPEGDTI